MVPKLDLNIYNKSICTVATDKTQLFPWIKSILQCIYHLYVFVAMPLILKMPMIFRNMTFRCICCTLRSWVNEMFTHSRTVSPRLENNYASKCISDNFPHTKYTSPCVEKCQNCIAMDCFSPIAVKSHEKKKNNGTSLSRSFPRFLDLLPIIGEHWNIKV